MKLLFILVSTSLFAACASPTKPTSAPTKDIPVNEDFYPYHNSESSNKEAVNTYQLRLTNDDDIQPLLLNSIQGYIIDKRFLSSQIFPGGSLFRKRINTFSLDQSSSPRYVIDAKLSKDEKYSSYKLVIQKIAPQKKEETFRQWLFPDNLTQEQLAIRISKIIVKYSFQEL